MCHRQNNRTWCVLSFLFAENFCIIAWNLSICNSVLRRSAVSCSHWTIWKAWKVLEKYPWNSCIFSSGSNYGKQVAIVKHTVCVDYCVLKYVNVVLFFRCLFAPTSITRRLPKWCIIHNKTSTVLINSCYLSLPPINHIWFTTCLHWCGQYGDTIMALSWWWRDDEVLQLSLRVLDVTERCWQYVIEFDICKLISGERKEKELHR